jgi:hypothetical protein
MTHVRWDQGEDGSTLVLAIVFLAVVGTVVGSLVFGIGNDLSNVTNLKSSRGVNYALAGAANVAANSGRFTYTTGTKVACDGVPTANDSSSPGVPTIQINGEWVALWCTTTQNARNILTNQVNREYQIYACPTAPSVSAISTAATCSASPALYAEVYFNDFATSGGGGVNNCTNPPATSPSCGLGMTVAKWIVKSK